MRTDNNHSTAVSTAIPSRRRSGKVSASERSSLVAFVSDALRRAEEKRELIRRSTVGVYSLRVKDGMFGVPFFAIDDSLAVKAQLEILPLSNVYCVGSYCMLTGALHSIKPRLVVSK